MVQIIHQAYANPIFWDLLPQLIDQTGTLSISLVTNNLMYDSIWKSEQHLLARFPSALLYLWHRWE